MSEAEEYKEKLDAKVKEYEENCQSLSNFALEETSLGSWHKLLRREDFVLPRSVCDELAPLVEADLIDFWNRSNGRI